MSWFAPILGQEQVLAEFDGERAHGRLVHAYLFEGAVGTGRLHLARALSAATLCAAPIAAGGCGTCAPCRRLAAGTHPDYLELPREPQMLRIARFCGHHGGDDSREAIEHPPVLDFLHTRPSEGGRRICVIPDAERMNEAAANAFLKTLEEPPGDALLLLTAANRERMRETVVSRCRRIRVQPLPTATIAAELLRRQAAAEPDATALAELAEGSLGAALDFAGGEGWLEAWRWTATALEASTPVEAVRLGRGWAERTGAVGADAAARRREALRLLDLAALRVRRRLRENLGAVAGAAALAALWRASEQLAANVRAELALAAAALDLTAALRRG